MKCYLFQEKIPDRLQLRQQEPQGDFGSAHEKYCIAAISGCLGQFFCLPRLVDKRKGEDEHAFTGFDVVMRLSLKASQKAQEGDDVWQT